MDNLNRVFRALWEGGPFAWMIVVVCFIPFAASFRLRAGPLIPLVFLFSCAAVLFYLLSDAILRPVQAFIGTAFLWGIAWAFAFYRKHKS